MCISCSTDIKLSFFYAMLWAPHIGVPGPHRLNPALDMIRYPNAHKPKRKAETNSSHRGHI